MEFRLLEYFMTICETLHFTKAAEKLRISQPTLSHQIKLLENQVGTPLFKRVGKKVYITQAGKCLLEHAEKAFFELEQAKIKINEIRGLQRGELTIGCSGSHLLTSTILSFSRNYPNIGLSIKELTTEETIDEILHHRLDLGIIYIDSLNNQLDNTPLFIEELLFVVSENDPLATLTSIELTSLQSIPLTLLPKKYLIRQLIDQSCKNLNFELYPKIELTNLAALHQIVSKNQIATILPKSYLVGINDPTIRCIPIVGPIPQHTVGIVYQKNAFMDTAISSFINSLIDTYKQQGIKL
ncbi:LysR substrate-binding domain-containing protein [Lysinibacillus sp. BW-2-10]|uniref:LysR substrate-binding domain-containing protein n=1 Tax=Lysinibacillus sp. BW-2-10 TaxID=2590030 RepID=UPI0016434A65|nr:LysR substrate-binding domain-containing protein [Lysinibacillus sp. BW-2-10]